MSWIARDVDFITEAAEVVGRFDEFGKRKS